MLKRIIGTICAVVLVLGMSVGCGQSAGSQSSDNTAGISVSQDKVADENTAEKIGTYIGKYAQELMACGFTYDESGLLPGFTDSEQDAAAKVGNIYVSKEYFAYRMALYASWSGNDPLADTEDLMKTMVSKCEFAEKKQLMPTKSELEVYCNGDRETSETNEASQKTIDEMVSGMGMSEDDYWNNFRMNYEAPYMMISENISRYLEENSMDEPVWTDITLEVVDKDFLGRLEKNLQS